MTKKIGPSPSDSKKSPSKNLSKATTSKASVKAPQKAIKLPKHRDVFLSHKSANKDFVRRLAADIESDISGGQLFTWLDEAEIHHGSSIPGSVEDGLQKSRFFAAIMTPEYFEKNGSGWTDAEWHSALHIDPDNRKSRIIPILAADCPFVPYLLRHLNLIDMREKNYKYGLAQLLRVLRDQPLPRPTAHRGQLVTPGGKIDRASLMSERAVPAADPDAVNERLYCNLLPVERLPKYVYVGSLLDDIRPKRKDGSKATPSKAELKDIIFQAQIEQGSQRPFSPAFRSHEDRIFSFHNFEDSPLAAIVDAENAEAIETKDLLADEQARNIVISLLNMTVTRHCSRIGLEIDNTKINRVFFPRKGDGPNRIKWKPKRTLATRSVAKPYYDQNKNVKFWVHQGAYLKMIFLANRLYLQIKPTWVITKDGKEVMQGPTVARVVNKYTGPERNHQILYHVRFWTTILRQNKGLLEMRAGDQTVDFSTIPAFIDQAYGIEDDNEDVLGLLDLEAELFSQREDELIERLPDLTVVGNLDSEESATDLDEEDGE